MFMWNTVLWRIHLFGGIADGWLKTLDISIYFRVRLQLAEHRFFCSRDLAIPLDVVDLAVMPENSLTHFS